jgi:biopolymer transport protein TolR
MPQIQRESGSSLSEINMVPFIDVVLVLLIIFMITAPILQSGIEVDVPKTKTVKEMKDPQHQAVYVRCDETVPFGSWATVVDALRQSGIQNISVVTQPLTERPQAQ